MMHSTFETEEQMVARIEAEERARLDFKDDGPSSHLAATGELQPAAEETEAQMRARIETEERARLDDAPDAMADRVWSTCCRSASAMRLGPNAELLQLARRFCLLGLSAWGTSSDQIAQLRAEHWAALDGDEGFASLVAFVDCLPGPTSTLLATALGLLHGGPRGGVVAALAFAAPSMLALGALGCAARAFAAPSVLSAAAMGLAAAALALVAQSALTAAAALTSAPPLPRALCLASAAAQRAQSALRVPWLAASPRGHSPLHGPTCLLRAAPLGPRREPSPRGCRGEAAAGALVPACPKSPIPPPLAIQVTALLGAGTSWAMPAALCAAGAASGAVAAWRPERGVREGYAEAEGHASPPDGAVAARVPLRPRLGGGEPCTAEQRHSAACSLMHHAPGCNPRQYRLQPFAIQGCSCSGAQP